VLPVLLLLPPTADGKIAELLSEVLLLLLVL
jgi:hypothetical protein